MSPQFHLVHDDDFQTITQSGSNALPPNWRDVFDTHYHTDDENFQNPL